MEKSDNNFGLPEIKQTTPMPKVKPARREGEDFWERCVLKALEYLGRAQVNHDAAQRACSIADRIVEHKKKRDAHQ
jgi:hypothetical protein